MDANPQQLISMRGEMLDARARSSFLNQAEATDEPDKALMYQALLILDHSA